VNIYSSPNGFAALQLMIYHPIKEIWFYLLAAAVLLALAGYVMQYRRTPAAMCWIIGLVARAFILFALVLITVSPAPEDKLLWAKIQQFCSVLIIPLYFMLVISVAGKITRVSMTIFAALVALTAAFMLALATAEWHGVFWRGYLWDGATFGFVRGPVFWITFGVVYLQFLAVTIMCLVLARKASGLRRWQLMALPVAPLMSMAGHAMWAAGKKIGAIPPLPLGFILSGVVWTWVYIRLRVLNMMPLAESTVSANIDDSLIITDDQGYIMELNPSAQRRFGSKAPGLIGRHFAEAFASWPEMAALLDISEATAGEMKLEGSGYYLYHVTPLTGWRGMSIGKAIVLRDIGELKKAQARIIEQEKAISIMTERERLGRELHDGQGQVWNYMGMKLRTVEAYLAGDRPEQAKQEIGRLLGTVGEMNADARESIVGLKLAGDRGEDFLGKLQDYLAWYRDSPGIDVELSMTDGQAETPSGLREVQLLRIIQEALTNIRKHAGARCVKVGLGSDGGRTVVWIEDDGCGFDTAATAEAKASFGLKIMAERAEEAGGRLAIESSIGGGTRVTVSFDAETGNDRGQSDAYIAGR